LSGFDALRQNLEFELEERGSTLTERDSVIT
jgi:hypothetical protein